MQKINKILFLYFLAFLWDLMIKNIMSPENQKSTDIASVFMRRKETFINSLEKVLTASSKDAFIHQMFRDKHSAMYVPDRVCELIERYLTDDREALINDLYRRIRSLEACFGTSNIKRLEEIGDEILTHVDNSVQNEKISQINISKLRSKAQSITMGTQSLQGLISKKNKLLTNIGKISQMFISMRRDVETLQKQYIRDLHDIKRQTRNKASFIYEESILQQQSVQDAMKQSQKMFKQDSEKLQRRYAKEIEQHVQKEEQLTKDLNRMTNRHRRICEKCANQQNELDELKNKVSQLESLTEQSIHTEESAIQLESQISVLRKELESKNRQIENLVEQQNQRSELDSSLQAALAKSRAAYSKKEKQVHKLKNAFETLRNEYEDMSHKLALAHTDQQLVDAKFARMKSLETERQNYLEKIGQLETDLDSTRSMYSQAESDIERLTRENSKMKQILLNNSQETSEKTRLHQQIDDLMDEISHTKSQLSDAEAEIDKYKLHNHVLTQKNSGSEQRIKELELELEKSRHDIESIILTNRESASKILDLKNEDKNKEEQMCEMKKKILISERSNKQLQEKLDELTLSNKETLSSLAEANESVRVLETKNTQLEIQLDNVTIQLNKKEEIIRRFVDNDGEAKKQIEKMEDEIKTTYERLREQAVVTRMMEKKTTQLNQEITDLKAKLGEFNGKLRERDDELQQLRTERDDAVLHSSSLEEQNKQLSLTVDEQKSNNTALSERIAQSHNEITELEKNNEKLKLELEDVKRTLKFEQEKFSKEKSNFQEEIKNAIEEAKKEQKDKNEATVQIEQKSFEILTIQKELKRREEEIDFLKAKSDRELKRRDDLLTIERQKNEANVSRFKEMLEQEHKNAEEETQRLRRINEKDREDSENRIKIVEQQKDKLEKSLKESQDEIQVLKNKCNELNSILHRERTISEDFQSKANTQISQLSTDKENIIQAARQIAEVNSFEEIPTKLAEYKNIIQQKDTLLEKVKSIFGVSKNSDVTIELNKHKDKLDKLEMTLNEIMYVMDENDEGHIVENIVNSKKAIDSISSYFKGTNVKTLPDVVKDIIIEQKENSKIIDMIKTNLNDKINIDELPTYVGKLHRDMKNIEKAFPDSSNIVDDVNALKSKSETISKILGNESSNEIDKLTKIKYSIDKTASLLDSNLDDIPLVVEEMKGVIDNVKNTLGLTTLKQIPTKIREKLSNLDEVKSVLNCSNDNEIQKKLLENVHTLDEVKDILGKTDNVELLLQIKEDNNALDQLKGIMGVNETASIPLQVREEIGRVDNIMNILGVERKSDIQERLRGDIALIDNVKKTLGVEDKSQISYQLAHSMEKLDEVRSVLNAESISSMPMQLQSELNRIEEIRRTLSVKNKEDLPKVVNQYLDQLKVSMHSLGLNDVNEVSNKVREVVKDNDEMLLKLKVHSKDEFANRTHDLLEKEKLLTKVLNITELAEASKEHVLNTIDEMHRNSNKLMHIEESVKEFGVDGTIEEKFSELCNRYRKLDRTQLAVCQIVEAEYGSEPVSAVAQLRKDLGSASDLFSRLFAILAGPKRDRFEFTFPLQDEVVNNLIDVIQKFKVKTDLVQEQTAQILTEARQSGYIGQDMLEASQFIAQSAVSKERDIQNSRFSEQLRLISANTDKIKLNADKEKGKLMDKITKLTQENQQIRENAIEREKAVLEENETIKTRQRFAQDDAEKQKKIKEELIRFIAEKGYDKEFLTNNLSKTELSFLKLR